MATEMMERAADLSPCGRYRYSLTRIWDDDERKGHVLWIMLNPSTADASCDDPTIRRCIGFSRAWRCGGMAVVNLFALRSPHPAHLLAAEDPVGPDNDAHIRRLLGEYRRRQDTIVAAWGGGGNHRRLRGRRDAVLRILPVDEIRCLNITASGDPLHPLYARGGLAPVTYGFPASFREREDARVA